jgi:hypothetical protein
MANPRAAFQRMSRAPPACVDGIDAEVYPAIGDAP